MLIRITFSIIFVVAAQMSRPTTEHEFHTSKDTEQPFEGSRSDDYDLLFTYKRHCAAALAEQLQSKASSPTRFNCSEYSSDDLPDQKFSTRSDLESSFEKLDITLPELNYVVGPTSIVTQWHASASVAANVYQDMILRLRWPMKDSMDRPKLADLEQSLQEFINHSHHLQYYAPRIGAPQMFDFGEVLEIHLRLQREDSGLLLSYMEIEVELALQEFFRNEWGPDSRYHIQRDDVNFLSGTHRDNDRIRKLASHPQISVISPEIQLCDFCSNIDWNVLRCPRESEITRAGIPKNMSVYITPSGPDTGPLHRHPLFTYGPWNLGTVADVRALRASCSLCTVIWKSACTFRPDGRGGPDIPDGFRFQAKALLHVGVGPDSRGKTMNFRIYNLRVMLDNGLDLLGVGSRPVEFSIRSIEPEEHQYDSDAVCFALCPTRPMININLWENLVRFCQLTHMRCIYQKWIPRKIKLIRLISVETKTMVQLNDVFLENIGYCILLQSRRTNHQRAATEFRSDGSGKCDDLLSTYQDAMYLASVLECSYLWVDSLCVYQDHADLEYHDDIRDAIFRSSVLTIICENTVTSYGERIPGVQVPRSLHPQDIFAVPTSDDSIYVAVSRTLEPRYSTGPFRHDRILLEQDSFPDICISRRLLVIGDDDSMFICKSGNPYWEKEDTHRGLRHQVYDMDYTHGPIYLFRDSDASRTLPSYRQAYRDFIDLPDKSCDGYRAFSRVTNFVFDTLTKPNLWGVPVSHLAEGLLWRSRSPGCRYQETVTQIFGLRNTAVAIPSWSAWAWTGNNNLMSELDYMTPSISDVLVYRIYTPSIALVPRFVSVPCIIDDVNEHDIAVNLSQHKTSVPEGFSILDLTPNFWETFGHNQVLVFTAQTTQVKIGRPFRDSWGWWYHLYAFGEQMGYDSGYGSKVLGHACYVDSPVLFRRLKQRVIKVVVIARHNHSVYGLLTQSEDGGVLRRIALVEIDEERWCLASWKEERVFLR